MQLLLFYMFLCASTLWTLVHTVLKGDLILIFWDDRTCSNPMSNGVVIVCKLLDAYFHIIVLVFTDKIGRKYLFESATI